MILNFCRKHGFVFVLLAFSVILSIRNYTPGTWLTGWDNLHPEFDFPLNITRSLMAVWQDYQGLGILGGMSHASDLPRQLILLIFSLFLPKDFLRYLWQFLMLMIGPVGVYYFVYRYIGKGSRYQTSAFLGGLFYLFNLATLLNFYAPQSMFTTQYGFLPWLLFFAGLFIEEKKKSYLVAFAVLTLLSSTQAYTATLFFAYILFLGVFLLSLIVCSSSKLTTIKNAFIVVATVLAMNSYWMLPLAYFIKTKAYVVSSASINRFASEESFLLNKRYGTIGNVLILKGFWFDNYDYRISPPSFTSMLQEWSNYLGNRYILLIGYFLSSIVLLGFIYSLFKKEYRIYSFLFLLSVFFLLNANPPLGSVFSLLQKHVPLFREALRFPYTKFSIVAAFSYSILFSFGSHIIFDLLKTKRILRYVIVVVFSALFILWMKPAFDGYLSYPELRVAIPSDYFALFKYMKGQNSRQRILNLPMSTLWGWPRYSWGYRGSGFLWYGLQQPILDRAFDVWSDKNEEAYREVSYAIYSGNPELLEKLLTKFNITWILFDKNVFIPIEDSERTTLVNSFDRFILSSSSFEKKVSFGNLDLYVFKPNYTSNSFIRTLHSVSAVNNKNTWSNYDIKYILHGDYVYSPDSQYFPFDFIDSQRDLTSHAELTDSYVSLNVPIESSKYTYLNVASVINDMDLIPLRMQITRDHAVVKLKIGLNQPEIYVNEQLVNFTNVASEFTTLVYSSRIYIVVGDDVFGPFDSDSFSEEFDFYTSPEKTNVMVVPEMSRVFKIDNTAFNEAALDSCADPQAGSFSIEKVNGKLILTANKTSACYFTKLTALQNFSGLVQITFDYNSENTSPRYCLYSEKKKTCLNDTQKYLDMRGTGKISEVIHLEEPSDTVSMYFYTDYDGLYAPSVNEYSNFALYALSPTFSGTLALSHSDSVSVPIQSPSKVEVRIPVITQDIHTSKLDVNDNNKDCANEESKTVSKEFITEDGKSFVRYEARDSKNCLYINADELAHNTAYLVRINTRKLAGKNQLVCLSNTATGRCDIEDKLYATNEWKDIYLLQPKMHVDDRGYILRIENNSIGDDKAVNDYSTIQFMHFPYKFVHSISLSALPIRSDTNDTQPLLENTVSFSNYFNFVYAIKPVSVMDQDTLLLNTSFDPGWVAFCGIRPCNAKHVMANDWANSWVFMDTPMYSGTIYLIFVPQFLEFIGFGFLVMYFIFFWKKTRI